MDNQHSKTFAQQLLPNILAVIFSMSLMCVWLYLGFQQSQHITSYQTNVVQPNTAEALEKALLIQDIERTLFNSMSAKTGRFLSQNHESLQTQFAQIKQLPEFSRINVSPLLNIDSVEVARFADKSQQNEALRISGIRQLSQIAQLYDDNEIELPSSFQYDIQATTDRLKQVIAEFKQLNLQTALSHFEFMVQEIDVLLNDLKKLTALSPETSEVFSQASTDAEQLFYSEQLLISKWRGYLRLYHEYRKILETFPLHLTAERMDVSTPDSIQASVLVAGLNQLGLSATERQTAIAFVVLAFLQLLISCSLCWLLLQRVKLHQLRLKAALEEVLENEKVIEHGSNEDIEELCSLVSSRVRPLHSEDDYQLLAEHSLNNEVRLATFAQTVAWELDEKRKINTNTELLSALLALSPDDVLDKRKVFERDVQRNIISAMRKAKQNNSPVSIELTTLTGVNLELVVARDQAGYAGVVKCNAAITALKGELLQEQDEAEKTSQYLASARLKSAKKLSVKLVKAMLQSQELSQTQHVRIHKVMRPLATVHQQLEEEIATAQFNIKHRAPMGDINFVDEIHSAVFNTMAEQAWKNNRLSVYCDANICPTAKLNVSIFSQLLSSYIRLALQPYLNAHLLLTVKAVDQNAGQQRVQFSAIISTEHALTELPSFAKLLLNGVPESEKNIPDFFTLLRAFYCENQSAELLEKGYMMSIEIPIATSVKVSSKEPLLPNQLQHILVLCRNKQLQHKIKKYFDKPNYNVEGLAQCEQFAHQFDVKYLTRRKLDLVVLIEHQKGEIEEAQRHIQSLPKSKQPKLLVLQNPYIASLARNGLYSLSSAFISKRALFNEYSTLWHSSMQDNCLISPELFSHTSYLPSDIELLLAVKTPHQHYALLLLLKWLGFQVKLVTNGEAMQERWRTGRYLVLITEFEQSPFIKLDIGNKVARGVFNFSNEQVFEVEEDSDDFGTNWQLGIMPKSINFKALEQLLANWLHLNKPTLEAKVAHRKSVGEAPESEVQNKIFDSSLIEQLPPAFDLEEFSQNQGSPELAVFMLDEYIASMKDEIQLIEISLKKQSYQKLGATLEQLTITANIMSAKGLKQILQQLHHAHSKKAFDKMARLVEQAKLELSAIVAYADAI